MSEELTQPHDYRVLLEACPELTIVGGQAVSVWAITYLDAQNTSLEGFGSVDLDVVAKTTVDNIIKALPGWANEKRSMWSMDRRLLRLTTKTDDGRLLIVEVLSKVLGLDNSDLDSVQTIEKGGVKYRVLDPIAMLRAKVANLRELKQDGTPPRQDRPHLQIIAQCVAPFLRDAHSQAVGNPELHDNFSKTLSRLFRTLNERHILKTLLTEGIQPLELIPGELKESPIEKVKTACAHQLPRLAAMPDGKA